MSSKSSTTDPVADPQVEVARVRRPHGVRGALLVEVSTDVPERLGPGSRLLLVTASDRRSVTVRGSRPHAGGRLVELHEVTDREAAERLRGAVLLASAASSPALPPGSWYQHQLLGCRCRDRRAGELGTVRELVNDGGGLLLMIDSGDRRLLVPFVREFLLEVDPESGRIELDLPPGLVETCESRS